MRIKYKMFTDEDVNTIAAFWSENSGWDVIDGVEWERRFLRTPFGRSEVVLGFDEDTHDIIGQFAFIPATISVHGKETKAYRPFAPIFHRDLQTKFGITSWFTGQHPMIKMYNMAGDYLTSHGATLIYMVPDPRWSRVLQAFPFVSTHKFPLWSHPINSTLNYDLPGSIKTERIDADDPAIDVLWKKTSEVYTCSIVRNSHSLPWKTSHGNYKVYAVKEGEEMLGLFACIYKAHDHQWLICDMIVKDNSNSTKLTIEAACNVVYREHQQIRDSINDAVKVAILATAPIETVVSQLGFTKEKYQFTLAVQVLNKDHFGKKDVSPANWYVSAND